jgi:hypothetical protein
MTYRLASRRAQRALLAIGAGLTLAVAAAPVAQATPTQAMATADGTCTANTNGALNSGVAPTTCPGKPSGGDTGHKVG